MNNDLISREALKKELLKRLWFVSSPETDAQAIKDIIDNAPAVENITVFTESTYEKAIADLKEELQKIIAEKRPKGEWIPVSERLPEYSGLYLISVDELVTVANFTGTYFMNRCGGRIEVYAWQPLPEPYMKGGAE